MAAVARWDDIALPEPPAQPTRRVRWVQTCAVHGAAIVLFTLLTVCRAWPIVLHPASTVAPDPVDPVFNIWAVALANHNVLTWPDGLWSLFHANIFYPSPHAASFTDVFVGLLPFSLPLHLIVADPVVLTNLAVALSFVLSAYGVFLLGHKLTESYAAGLVAGLIFTFSPVRMEHIGHLTIISTQWLVAGAYCLVRAWDDHRWRWWLASGLLCGLSAVTMLYYAAYLTPPLLVVAALHYRSWKPRRVRGALVAAGISALFVMPFVIPYLTRHTTIGSGYGTGSSTDLLNILYVFPGRPIDGAILPAVPYQMMQPDHGLFPGFVPLALALLGWHCREARPWGIFAAACAIVAFGSHLDIGGRILPIPLPYAWLAAFVPHFALFRDPVRATTGFYLGLAIVAAWGVRALVPRFQGHRRRFTIRLLLTGVTALELWSPVPTVRINAIPAGEYWLSRQPRIHVVAELPLANATAVDWTRQTEIMYDSTAHWKNLVNGSASVDPTGMAARRAVLDTFPSPASLRLLRRLHVDAVVLRLPWLPAQQVARARAICHTAYRDSVEQICIGPWS